MQPPHPWQPLTKDTNGRPRFRENAIVRWMLDEGRRAGLFDLNRIAELSFTQADREQFYQLIGTSVIGFAEVFCDSPDVLARLDADPLGRVEMDRVREIRRTAREVGPVILEEGMRWVHPPRRSTRRGRR